MADIITCPSGLTGRVRGMKVREERILTDRKLAKDGGQLDELLGACWIETIDPGPYVLADGGLLDWGKVLQGDRFYVLLQIRIRTYGPTYEFSVDCASPSCRARIAWELDLTHLPVRSLSGESRVAFVTGNRLETRLPSLGKRLSFRLMTGHDERQLPALQRASPQRLLSSVLAYRVWEIDGVDDKDKRRTIEDLEMADATYLLREFERVDCGVETNIDIECPTCFAVQEVELPFDKAFFLPAKAHNKPQAPTPSSRS